MSRSNFTVMTKFSRFYLTLFFVSLLVFMSCNNDDEPEMSPIVGVWNYDDFEVRNIFIDGQPLSLVALVLGIPLQDAEAQIREFINSFADLENTTITFTSNGTYEIRSSGTVEEAGTYELLNGNSLLRLSAEDFVTDVEVLLLTASQLNLVFDLEERTDLLGEDLPEVTVSGKLQLNLVK